MKPLYAYLDRFFFEKISANGFGLMRIMWAAVTLAFLVQGLPDVVRYYSESGIMPQELGHLVFRSTYRFTILEFVTDPTAVVILYLLWIVATVYMLIGIWPRFMTIMSVLLMFSFHERNLQPLGGGDTVLRNIGFLLMIAPCISAFSYDRLEQQWKHWKKSGTLLAPLQMSIWPYRLLLWQLLIIYLTSGWDKLTGTMWWDGTSVGAVLHHPHFVRFPMYFMDIMSALSPVIAYSFLVYEFTWALLLIPKDLTKYLPVGLRRHSLKRWLMLAGVTFHGGIFILMDVGSFSLAMMTVYIGLLQKEDFAVFKAFLNKRWKKSIAVLYDSACNLCIRSAFMLQLMDSLGRIQIVDFRNATARKKVAPTLKEVDLDRAMHIVHPNGKTYLGFYAFRALSWNMPWTWLIAPFLYIPGVAPIGILVYERVAANRNKCADGKCSHK